MYTHEQQERQSQQGGSFHDVAKDIKEEEEEEDCLRNGIPE